MRKILFAILLALPFLAQAQTKSPTQKVDYQIKGQRDSFFLDEIVSTIDTSGVIVNVTKSGQLFRSKDQLFFYIGNLRAQAKQYVSEAEKIRSDAKEKARKTIEEAETSAKSRTDAAPKIEEIANKIDAVARKSEDFFSGKTPDPAPAKPKKKKSKN